MRLNERVEYLERVYRFTLEALESAASLSDFQQNLTAFDSPAMIIQEAAKRILKLLELTGLAIYRIDEDSADFYIAHCWPAAMEDNFVQELEGQSEKGTFAQALDMQKPLFVSAEAPPPSNSGQLILHRMATTTRIRGMLMAYPAKGLKDIPDSSLHLLSLIMLNTANSLESHELYRLLRAANNQLERKIEALDEQKAFYQQLFENSPLGLALVDTESKIIEVNSGFVDLFGYSQEHCAGRICHELILPRMYHGTFASLHASLLTGTPTSRELTTRNKQAEHIPVSFLGYPVIHDGKVQAVYYSFQDISSRKAFEQQLTYQAFHDSLTGLPNRALFIERLNQAIKRSNRDEHHRFAVLILDVDRFKGINDSLGHIIGDKLLQEIASRLASSIRNVDTVARLGGDEFAILLEGFHSAQEVTQVVMRCKTSLEEPFLISEQTILTSASIGIVLRNSPEESPEDLLRNADIAMYRAKETGGNLFKFFNPAMFNAALQALSLEAELRQAMAQENFSLYYQPIVSSQDGSLCGLEALVRWEHPTQGVISPSQFIPMAEETGLIVPLGEWVLHEACRQLKEWITLYPQWTSLYVSVNLSARQLGLRGLPAIVQSALDTSGIQPSSLKLEITESAMMRNIKLCQEVLTRLKELELQLVIDDFGTGYSSLSYLHQFPIDYLKIDQSFVSGSSKGLSKPEIVSTIMALANSMGIKAVAEGVENMNQTLQLRRLACPLLQGFLFSPPVCGKDVTALLGAGGASSFAQALKLAESY